MELVSLNGELLEAGDARISPFDHGLVVGDGVFETILVTGGRPFALDRHLDRLERSATGLGLEPIDRRAIEHAVGQVVGHASFTEGKLRVTVTDGIGPLGSGRLAGPQTVIVAASTIETGSPAATSSVTVVPWRRNEHGALAGLKTTSYGENARALAYAVERGSDEAIFANTAGNLCEGSGSNVFVVIGREVVTPTLASGCLPGITRGLVLELFPTVERDLPLEIFTPGEIDEAFLTSAIRGVQPIAMIGDDRFPSAPGPVTTEVAARFGELRAGNPNP